MKAIMVMFDTLNRHMLPPYGCEWTHAPNFERLAERAVTFDNCYVGSMPCMPARRELHTGRYNFLHRSWGPLEPFDDSMPEILRTNGVYTHLVTDHYHYWEDGGATYHNRYSTYEFSRGQEGDMWIGQVADPDIPESIRKNQGRWWRQDWVNRAQMTREEDQPQAKTFRMGLDFIHRHDDQDNWFLQIETFDPHEPYFTQQHYKDLYPHDYDGPHFDWPDYETVSQTREQVRHVRYEYAALLSMCDHYLGRVLDMMDAYNLWEDTLLIVNTDHGFLLSEHDWWGKAIPFWNEVAHCPLFIWDPRSGKRGERRSQLVQMIDLPATLLEYFGLERPADMQGLPLGEVIASNAPTREVILFGEHGRHVNVTDGHIVYMRAPVDPNNVPLFNYSLFPTMMIGYLPLAWFADAEVAGPFRFTKGCRVLKTPARTWSVPFPFGTLLYDLDADPGQETPLDDPAIEARMIAHMVRLMRDNDAPLEQYERLGLDAGAGED